MPASANRPWASVAVAGPPAGRKTRAPATGAALPVLDLTRQLLERLETDGRDRGAFAIQRDPVGDKRHEPVMPDGHAVGRTAQQGGWSLKSTLRSGFQRLRIEPEYLVGRDPPIRRTRYETGRQSTRPLDPEFHRDIGQRHAGCRPDDSDHSPGAAQLEDNVLPCGGVERQRVRGNSGTGDPDRQGRHGSRQVGQRRHALGVGRRRQRLEPSHRERSGTAGRRSVRRSMCGVRRSPAMGRSSAPRTVMVHFAGCIQGQVNHGRRTLFP